MLLQELINSHIILIPVHVLSSHQFLYHLHTSRT